MAFCAAQEIGTHFLIRTCVDRLAGDGNHTIADEMDEVFTGAAPGRGDGAAIRSFALVAAPLATVVALSRRMLPRNKWALFQRG